MWTDNSVGLGVAPAGFVREDQVVMPAAMIAVADARMAPLLTTTPGNPGMSLAGMSSLGDGWEYEYAVDSDPREASAPKLTFINKRHQGRWNVLCCDGHIQSFTTPGLFSYKDDEVLKMWNRDHLPHRELLLPGLP